MTATRADFAPPDLGQVTRLSDALTAEYLEESRLVPVARQNGQVSPCMSTP